MGDKKERILTAALHLFARDGYEAVSVSQIAGALGITKGALYRHYQNKRDIFDHIVARMEDRDKEQAERFDLPEGPLAQMESKYRNASLDRFADYCEAQFAYWTEDDFASSFRKMLTVEQFRNEEMQKLYQQYLALGPAGYVADLFDSLGISNPREQALHLYALMFLFYSIYDGAKEKTPVREQFQKMLKGFTETLF